MNIVQIHSIDYLYNCESQLFSLVGGLDHIVFGSTTSHKVCPLSRPQKPYLRMSPYVLLGFLDSALRNMHDPNDYSSFT